MLQKRNLILLSFFSLAISTSRVLAQESQAGEAAAGLAACAGCGTVLIIIPLAFIAINIALLVWVARDARARGMDTPALWMILVLVTSFIGLIIYLFARPQGNLIACPHCGNRRLQVSAVCPTCKNP